MRRERKLLIISHTEHHFEPNGQLSGWGPTINEINYLSNYWETVVHVSCLQHYRVNPSFQPYSNTNIRFVSIPVFGGKRWFQKLDIFYLSPLVIIRILREIRNCSHIQIRVPMGIGVYVLPLFLFIPRKFILWVKYANNWGKVSKSLGYRFQRWFLNKNYLRCKVTINGIWPNQFNHLQSFENPCISDLQLAIGTKTEKNFSDPWVFLFAGRLESDKGIDLIIDVINNLRLKKITEWVFIGDGPMKMELQFAFEQANIPIRMTGFLGQAEVHSELMKAHFLVLPSKSEGFPKVLAEAWNYGVIPIISPVGSIPHYVKNGENGFLMRAVDEISLRNIFQEVFKTDIENLDKISKKGKEIVGKFTFEYYIDRLNQAVFK